jgi:hypothetical protein
MGPEAFKALSDPSLYFHYGGTGNIGRSNRAAPQYNAPQANARELSCVVKSAFEETHQFHSNLLQPPFVGFSLLFQKGRYLGRELHLGFGVLLDF